ncbi:hypothetical protein [Rhodococcoides fascians]|uniref:hypothetical protein n=1 Tax=Rhodococcoides fascians TaxID=1828 RepID=UPI0036728E7B
MPAFLTLRESFAEAVAGVVAVVGDVCGSETAAPTGSVLPVEIDSDAAEFSDSEGSVGGLGHDL